jgi:RimJ/RimL family protein N-acetyltransferase
VIARSHQGRGLAAEAAQAMLSLAFDELALERVIARIDEPNEASRRMIARLGFTLDGPTDDEGEDGNVLLRYSITRDAAAALRG